MRRTLSAAALAFTLALCPHPRRAQQPQNSPAPGTRTTAAAPTVEQIIGRYVQAIGGEAAHRKLTSRVIKSTFVIEGMQGGAGTAETYQKAPAKVLVVLNIPGAGVTREGYDGAVGWTQEPGGEPQVQAGAELASAKLDADFYKDVRLTELFPKLTLKGTERVGGGDAYKLEGVTADGYSETMYFDVESGLLVRTDALEETAGGPAVVEIHYGDYREVDGVRMPFAARHSSPELNITFKVVEVRHNVPIEDAKFAKPGSR